MESMQRIIITDIPIVKPIKAPNLFAFGKNIPRKKRPTRGPEIAPNVVKIIWKIPPKLEQAKAIEVAKMPKNT